MEKLIFDLRPVRDWVTSDLRIDGGRRDASASGRFAHGSVVALWGWRNSLAILDGTQRSIHGMQALTFCIACLGCIFLLGGHEVPVGW
jgi:hypothetical protein